MSTLVFGL